MTFVCKDHNPEKIFLDMPTGNLCPDCGAMVFEQEKAKVNTPPQSSDITGDNGLGIIIMDMSLSMNEIAFPNSPGYVITKAGVVASALATSISKIRNINKAEWAYVTIIGFTNDAKILGTFKASEINTDTKYWVEWFNKSIIKVQNLCGQGTNITAALRLARKLYDDALMECLDNIPGFKPMYQNIRIGTTIYDIANIGVFIYSDGEHYADEPLVNHFSDASLILGQSNISGVTSAFLGNAESAGYANMRDIAGVCPKHNIKAVIHVNQPNAYDYLRDLFHMTSSTSGFCVECAKADKTIPI